MPSYDAEAPEYAGGWLERYPSWAVAGTRWYQQRPPWEWPREWNFDGPLRLPDLREAGYRKALQCPRLFISYRQYDRVWAFRIAWLAKMCGFDFWLDVLDPALLQLKNLGLTPAQEQVATAMAVEMGLLHCSHVIALMTPQSRGTLWIPYEYGRVKDDPPVSIQAGCWLDPALAASDFAEYLLLGKVTRSESEIQTWLAQELVEWAKDHGTCRRGSAERWTGGTTTPLPSPFVL